MRAAMVYASVTGNTKELADLLMMSFIKKSIKIEVYTPGEFCSIHLNEYDAIVIGTYTWGSGNIPKEMDPVFREFELQDVKEVVTGVFGTGDRFYSHFCGAVDRFRDMLYVHTNLAVTLKVELFPQSKDIPRADKFVNSILDKINMSDDKG